MIVVFENYKAAVRNDAGSIAFLAAVFGFLCCEIQWKILDLKISLELLAKHDVDEGLDENLGVEPP